MINKIKAFWYWSKVTKASLLVITLGYMFILSFIWFCAGCVLGD